MSTIKSSTTTTTAYSVTADTTGTLVFQTGSTPTTAMTIGTDQSVTFAGSTSFAGSTFTSLTDSGNLTFTGTGNRITGDFSNATGTSRVLIQTSTSNSNTLVGAIPNGTGTQAGYYAYNGTDPANSAFIRVGAGAVTNSVNLIQSTAAGTGTTLPLAFYMGGSEVMRLDTSGNLGIGTSSPQSLLDVTGNDPTIRLTDNAGSPTATFSMRSTDATYRIRDVTNSIDRLTIDSSGNVGIGVTPATTGFLEIKAGTTSAVPILLNSGTNKSTAVAGGIEYTSPIFTGTPIGAQRGIIPNQQYFRLNADLAGANVNTAQSVFGVGVTLSSSTVYRFEALYAFSRSAGATSHTIATGFGGTATVNNVMYGVVTDIINSASTVQINNTQTVGYISTVSATVVTNAVGTTSATASVHIKGTISINVGGTFIPQYTLSAAPGGAYSTLAGSHFLIYPVGAAGSNTSVGTWA